ncbi:MAG: LytTR family DNA-binding domain-containing protein [Reichenbachiella sp.]|uniref:LytTR family DNA-binding domain-containing protein n=1 Tax=Reichenbachiella sp. TaxID=2184521 RepID=UPI0032639371
MNQSNIARQLMISGILTAAVFGLLVYSINYFIFGIITPITRFLSSLLIAELIILVETLYFITRDLYVSKNTLVSASTSEVWQISSGRKTQMVKESDISYLYSQAGIVYLITHDGRKILTQFNSFNEVKEAFDLDSFFQVNRQYLVRPQAIDTVMKEVNQKLKIKLSPSAPDIPEAAMISRYRSVDFKKWMAQ